MSNSDSNIIYSINIDIVKVVASLGVATSHFYSSSYYGEFLSIIFVELFFPLSGYILAPQLLMVYKSKKCYSTFILRRWYRTIPLYIFGILVTAAITNKIFSLDTIKYLTFTKYLTEFYFINNFFYVAWSLAVEEYFYILFPTLLLINKKKSILYSVVIFLLFILIFKISNYSSFDLKFNRINTLMRLDSIIFGFIFYIYKENIKKYLSTRLIFFITGLFILYLYIYLSSQTRFTSFIFLYFCPLYFSFIITSFDHKKITLPFIFLYIIKKISNISYSLYIVHPILLYFIIPNNTSFLIYITTLLLAAAFVNKYIEKPFLDLRPKYKLL